MPKLKVRSILELVDISENVAIQIRASLNNKNIKPDAILDLEGLTVRKDQILAVMNDEYHSPENKLDIHNQNDKQKIESFEQQFSDWCSQQQESRRKFTYFLQDKKITDEQERIVSIPSYQEYSKLFSAMNHLRWYKEFISKQENKFQEGETRLLAEIKST